MRKSKIRVGLLGATGRMGSILHESLSKDKDLRKKFELCFTSSGPRDENFSRFASAKADVVVDFSAPACTLAFARKFASLKCAFVVCTTGFRPAELTLLKKILKKNPWVFVPNTSLGVYMLRRALQAVVPLLPSHFSVHIEETHHTKKKDAPSGTALMLKKAVLELCPEKKVSMHSVRTGDVVGEHVIKFAGPSEVLTLTHSAENRSLFAEGALGIAEKIAKKKSRPRAYALDELFHS